ncbi:MAG: hypothetical protein ACI8P2_000306, partial [Candidatus Latescibacterota bacterium]
PTTAFATCALSTIATSSAAEVAGGGSSSVEQHRKNQGMSTKNTKRIVFHSFKQLRRNLNKVAILLNLPSPLDDKALWL